jgi:hypothetical protein
MLDDREVEVRFQQGKRFLLLEVQAVGTLNEEYGTKAQWRGRFRPLTRLFHFLYYCSHPTSSNFLEKKNGYHTKALLSDIGKKVKLSPCSTN